MNNNRKVFRDTQNAKFGEVFVTIGGRRYTLLNAKNAKATANVKSIDVPVLGNAIVGKKPTGLELKIVMTVYKVSDMFDKVIESYKNTGVLPQIDVQLTDGPDAASNIGKSSKIYRDCVIDGEVLLGMLDVEDKIIEQEITFFAMDFDSVAGETYRDPDYLSPSSTIRKNLTKYSAKIR